jgi:hypothetical protein
MREAANVLERLAMALDPAGPDVDLLALDGGHCSRPKFCRLGLDRTFADGNRPATDGGGDKLAVSRCHGKPDQARPADLVALLDRELVVAIGRRPAWGSWRTQRPARSGPGCRQARRIEPRETSGTEGSNLSSREFDYAKENVRPTAASVTVDTTVSRREEAPLAVPTRWGNQGLRPQR